VSSISQREIKPGMEPSETSQKGGPLTGKSNAGCLLDLSLLAVVL
jgi:hypothetical protein